MEQTTGCLTFKQGGGGRVVQWGWIKLPIQQ